MAIPRDFIDELLARTDIEDLVSGYVQLKKSGSSIKGLCPFHTEKTPSFSVNTAMQIYKCFGCGKGGNALTFIMEIENLPFQEAVETLASRAGMAVPEQESRGEYTSRRKRILELNREAAKHFYKMLASPAGQSARDYLASRGINKESVKKFGLGAAPDEWSLLFDAMTAKGFTKQELFDAGLCRQGQKGGTYDFFRNRLMFPVIDARGEVIAFSGRTLGSEEQGYKYLNSPDTIVFAKGKNLFGLNLARKSKAGSIILVEGNFDAVMLHQAGFDNTAAQLGSAFTPDQARLLAKYTENVILAFDGDAAGRKATLKVIPLIEATGKSVKVIDFGEGDPDDYIKKYGSDAFRILVERSENHTQYRLQVIASKHDINTDEGRLAYLEEAVQYLAQIANIPQREIYCGKVAQAAGVSADAVRNEINRINKKRQQRSKAEQSRKAARPRENAQPAARGLRYANEASGVAEEGVIRCLIKDRTLIKTAGEMNLSENEFTSPFLAKVFSVIMERCENDADITPALILSELEPGEAAHLTTVLDKPESLAEGERVVREYIKKIRTERLRNSPPGEETFRDIEKLLH